MFSLGTSEILVILIVALVVFGKRLPEVARSMGNALSEFRRGLTGLQREFNEEIMREQRPPAAPRPRTMQKGAGAAPDAGADADAASATGWQDPSMERAPVRLETTRLAPSSATSSLPGPTSASGVSA